MFNVATARGGVTKLMRIYPLSRAITKGVATNGVAVLSQQRDVKRNLVTSDV